MFVFFRCVAEAVAETGFRGFAEMVPGGKYACDVATSAWKKYKDKQKDSEIRAEIQELARASFEEARQAAVEAVKTAAPPGTTVEDRLTLELFLAQVPGAVRASLKRPEDVTGKTVPPAFALTTPDDVVKFLPARPPRFRPGNPVPGLAGWSLVEPLGSGGFGEVWLARHRSMASLCGAVKFCRGQQAQDLKHESALIDRVMAAGRHPNIVPLTNVHLEGEAPWLMYEYVSGGDLADLIRSWNGLPAEQRVAKGVAALRELASAVGHFHKLSPPVVHRDLKPANILYDRATGTFRITDFGIGGVMAKAALEQESRGGMTSAGRLASYLRGSHTPLYSSPQQRDGADPDPRDDVHALGVIGYQMLTGHLGVGAGPDFAEDLREAKVPADLIELLGRCVAQKADRRPATAAVLAEWKPTAPPPPVPPPKPQIQAQSSLQKTALLTHDPEKVRCPYPHCSRTFAVPPNTWGMGVRCPGCNMVILVPPQPEAPEGETAARPVRSGWGRVGVRLKRCGLALAAMVGVAMLAVTIGPQDSPAYIWPAGILMCYAFYEFVAAVIVGFAALASPGG